MHPFDMKSIESKDTEGTAIRWWSLVRRERRSRRDLAILCGSVVMTFAAFVFNMGWIRFIFLFTTMPIILMGLYTSVGFAIYWNKWRAKLFYAASVFHPLSYILLYDDGDHGPAYLFFGLIPIESNDEDFAQFLVMFAVLSFIASFGTLFTIMIQMWLTKRRTTKKHE